MKSKGGETMSWNIGSKGKQSPRVSGTQAKEATRSYETSKGSASNLGKWNRGPKGVSKIDKSKKGATPSDLRMHI